jgi:hypothetical protein
VSVRLVDGKWLIVEDALATDANCCGVTGACCVDELCTEETCSECNSLGGVFQGVGTACAGEGGYECPCDPPADPAECQKCVDGEAVSYCPESRPYCCEGVCRDAPCGACCDGEGGCDQQSEAACEGGGGYWQGPGTICCEDVVASEDCPRVCKSPYDSSCCADLDAFTAGIPTFFEVLFLPYQLTCPTFTNLAWGATVTVSVSGTPGVDITIGGVTYSAGVAMTASATASPGSPVTLTTPSGTTNLAGQIPLTFCFSDA